MIIEDKLERIANAKIPKGKHKLLYINSREAWIKAVLQLIDSGLVKEDDKKIIASLANNWEQTLIFKFSTLN